MKNKPNNHLPTRIKLKNKNQVKNIDHYICKIKIMLMIKNLQTV